MPKRKGVSIFIKKKLFLVVALIPTFWVSLQRSEAQVFSYCQKEISEYCPTKISEQETVICLKRRSNLLSPSCYKMLGTKFQHNILSQVQNESKEFERYQYCLLNWKNNRPDKKYKSCKAYGLLAPDALDLQCMNEIKLQRKLSVEDQFAYEVASYNMCQRYFLKNKEWKECYIENKEKREDYTITFNMCDSKIKKCLEQSKGRMPSQSHYPDCFLKLGDEGEDGL